MNETGPEQATVGEQARDWILRLDSGDFSAGDMVALDAWLDADPAHRKAFDQCRRVWHGLAASPQLAAMLDTPFEATPMRAKRSGRRAVGMPRLMARRPLAIGLSAAAAVVAAFVAGPQLLVMARADYRASNQVMAVTLPDGTLASLDAGAALDLDFDADRRTIRLLAGNAFFRVRHGDARPFRVELADGIAEDIGTSFEVRNGSAQALGRLTVAEGAVRAIGPAGSPTPPLVLHAGEAAAFATTGPLRLASPGEIAAWRSGDIVIDRASPKAALEEIGRYRSGPTFVRGDPGSGLRISGAFRIDRADDALTAIALQSGMTVRFLPMGAAIVSTTAQR